MQTEINLRLCILINVVERVILQNSSGQIRYIPPNWMMISLFGMMRWLNITIPMVFLLGSLYGGKVIYIRRRVSEELMFHTESKFWAKTDIAFSHKK